MPLEMCNLAAPLTHTSLLLTAGPWHLLLLLPVCPLVGSLHAWLFLVHPLNNYFTKHYAIPGRTDYLICRAPSKLKIRPSYSKMMKNFKMVTIEY